MNAAVWSICLTLFALGLFMVVLRRELLAMLLGLELMVNAANIGIVYAASLFGDAQGLCAALLIIAVAAAEAVVGLCLILMVYQSGRDPQSAVLRELRG
ncbi:MAG: NADH-quinone oxidoreductase subunit NuoK [Elusimicrobiota bacterium]